MRIERNGSVWCGRVIELSGVTPRFDGEQVLDAINGTSDELRVVCEKPGDLHAHVGRLRPGMTLRRSAALAAAARSRGWSAPQDEEYEKIQGRIEELSIPDTDTAAARKRLAETTDEIERQRERVARLQGKVKALREHPERQTSEPYRALERAMQKLSELETEHAAAEQTLERARERQRQRHDRHDERLALEDRAANLARAARKHLCDRLHGEFTRTIESLPGPDDDPVTVALTITRLGEIRAPVVLECDRFDNAQTAADWLNAPVVSL
ncbi:DUF7856 family protein [Halocatena pleomorpha]|uniref:J domain-containing protein n=1 Tax=Halocatena pleomorpha TaxID=1785090 RepID=A0A3P3RCN7_9EURY|nr:hypothetical protein [Halocatena pleomorpha]RRJ30470.1 hypothetical protein EIK79_09290 [Halocatena pleomorpha]